MPICNTTTFYTLAESRNNSTKDALPQFIIISYIKVLTIYFLKPHEVHVLCGLTRFYTSISLLLQVVILSSDGIYSSYSMRKKALKETVV